MKQIVFKLALVPYLFVLLNWAVVAGLYQYLRGVDGIWDDDGLRQGAR
jgi:hypothetical protein